MDKILETSLGRSSDLYFSEGSHRVQDSDVGRKVIEKCNNYDIFKQKEF